MTLLCFLAYKEYTSTCRFTASNSFLAVSNNSCCFAASVTLAFARKVSLAFLREYLHASATLIASSSATHMHGVPLNSATGRVNGVICVREFLLSNVVVRELLPCIATAT